MEAQLQGVAVNRRTARRIQLKFPLWFQTQKRPDELLSGMVQNMSATGVVFVTQALVEVFTSVKLFFDRLPGDRQGRHISGVVTRTELAGEPGQYLIGVQFMDVSEEDQGHIVAALQATDVMGLLRFAAKKGASDLHLSADHPPLVRIAGQLHPLRKTPLSGLDVRDMIYTLLDDRHRQVFERDLELNFSLSVTSLLRFRVNVHMQRGNVEAAFRRIAPEVRTFAELHLPVVVRRLAELRDGLVLITGPTGAGKTTTVTAMVEYINTTRAAVIITLENPIEHVHTYKRSVIKQREIGVDTRSYPAALCEAMRQDPDVIVIGEVRDHETMKAALDAAETGHLVLATLPAEDCVQSILRTYHFFPGDRQTEIQLQLAHCLRGIISLRMLPQATAPGLVPATEVLVCTDGVAHMIRSGTVAQIPSAIQTGARHGMHTFAKSMEALYKAGHITSDTMKEYR
ncbi:MAG TPA: PilT/PilU family type 4a pilus ATPase [Candidatus Tectomicrobia bacterium]